MTQLVKGHRILLLMLLLSLPSISAVFFTAALPSMTAALSISDAVAPMTMTIYLIGYTLGQLPYGPISNRFGRKRALAIGLDLALAGSLLCFFSTSFWFLCLGRFCQALGAAAGLQTTLTMISDEHAGAKTTRTLSLIFLAFAIIPAIGIAIGGFVTEMFGWRGCFAALALYTLLLNFTSRTLPETAKSLRPDALKLSKIAHGLKAQFANGSVLLHGLVLGLGSSILYVFVTEAPYIGIEQMGLTPATYGLWNISPSLGMVCGLSIASYLAYSLPERTGILTGIVTSLLGIILLAILAINGFNVAPALFLPMVIIQMGFSLTYSYASSKALADSTDKANGSSVLSFVNLGIATISLLIVGSISPITPFVLSAIFSAILILQWILWLILKPHHA